MINKARWAGFTIVELLIVIVVIAILASISVAAFNGIQARAKLLQHTAELDKIGKAVQLWSAGNDRSMRQSGAGASGAGYGGFSTKNTGSYTSISIEDLLRNSGYLTAEVNLLSGILLAPCTADTNDRRWLVIATVSPAPQRAAADQLAESGCNSSQANLYTGDSYNRNILKAY